MAKINKSTFGGKLTNDLLRGFGLQVGRSAGKQLEAGIKKRTLDTNSKFRRAVDRFSPTGDFQKDLKKIVGIINMFDEEYSTTKAYFQRDWYFQDDVRFIEHQLEFLQRICLDEKEETQHQRICKLWFSYLEKHNHGA
jgi:hypothetical protein